MSLKSLKTALVALGVPVYHYSAPNNQPPEYIVWAEDDGDDFSADEGHAEYAVTGTVDLYTMDEESALWQRINEVLNAQALAWYYNSTQYDEETELIHREWVFTCGLLDNQGDG